MGSPPGRTHFYLLLSALEISASEWVRALYPDQSQALALLAPGRRESHAKLLADLRAKDEHLDEVAALGLVDLIRVLERTPEAEAAARGEGLRWKDLGRGFGDFRNDVMHPVRAFAHATPDGLLRLRNIDRHLVRFIRLAEVRGSDPGLTEGVRS